MGLLLLLIFILGQNKKSKFEGFLVEKVYATVLDVTTKSPFHRRHAPQGGEADRLPGRETLNPDDMTIIFKRFIIKAMSEQYQKIYLKFSNFLFFSKLDF